MQELEKILEKMKEIKDGNRKEKLYAKYPPNGRDQETLNAYSQGYEDGTDNFYNAIVDDVRNHMNDGWIPVEDGLPEDREWYLTLFKEPETGFIGLPYIADYLGRKTKTTTNEGWIIRNCTDNDMENCDYYKNLESVAWRPLPETYRPERSAG